MLWLANLRPYLTNGTILVGIVVIEVESLPVICDESSAGLVNIVLCQQILSNTLLLYTTVLLLFFP